jgi:hypothetical protein
LLSQGDITARFGTYTNNINIYDADSMPWSKDERAVRNAVKGENGAIKSSANNPFWIFA